MIEKKTVIDQIEIARDGAIQIRFAVLLMEDGNEIDYKWHRTSVPPGGDIDAQIAAVNSHLSTMGKATVDSGRIAELKAVAAVVHTPARVKAFRDKLAASQRQP